MTDSMTPIIRLTKDLASAATTLSRGEARFLVDAYYMMQDQRIRSDAQVRALTATEEPHSILGWLAEQSENLENQVKRALDKYSMSTELGRWTRSICGIGPVITAGLMAHIDISKAPTVGHIWSFAGIEPTSKWEKGKKRPWNAELKTLCYKIGESFVKVQSNDSDLYGQIYAARKKQEVERNEAGANAEQAARVLAEKKIGKDTDAYAAYSTGKLPPAHIHARARRYAVKLFLAHYHEAAYRFELGREAPNPYPIAILGHAHRIPAPGLQ